MFDDRTGGTRRQVTDGVQDVLRQLVRPDDSGTTYRQRSVDDPVDRRVGMNFVQPDTHVGLYGVGGLGIPLRFHAIAIGVG